MKEKIIVNIMLLIPFIFGLYLCKTSTGGFYGNDSDLIGIPICFISEICNIFYRYISLTGQLKSEEIKTKSKKSVMTSAAFDNIFLCFFCAFFSLNLGADALSTAAFCVLLLLGYNIPVAVRRKDLTFGIVCLSMIMTAVSLLICCRLDVRMFYASIHKN